VTVRDCTVDNGDTTSDTEMGRESHCWMVNMVRFNDVDMHGCALACHTDGCNHAPTTSTNGHQVALVVAMATSLSLVALAYSRAVYIFLEEFRQCRLQDRPSC